MKQFETSNLAKRITLVITSPEFECLGEDGIKAVVRTIVDMTIRVSREQRITENLFDARNDIIRWSVSMYHTHDGSSENARSIGEFLDGYILGRLESTGILED